MSLFHEVNKAYLRSEEEKLKGYLNTRKQIKEEAAKGQITIPADSIAEQALRMLKKEGFDISTQDKTGNSAERMSISLHDAHTVQIRWT